MSYPLDLASCISLYKELCMKDKATFGEIQENLVRSTVEFINHAYHSGYHDGLKEGIEFAKGGSNNEK